MIALFVRCPRLDGKIPRGMAPKADPSIKFLRNPSNIMREGLPHPMGSGMTSVSHAMCILPSPMIRSRNLPWLFTPRTNAIVSTITSDTGMAPKWIEKSSVVRLFLRKCSDARLSLGKISATK